MKQEKRMVSSAIIHLDSESKRIADLIRQNGFPLSVFVRNFIKIEGRKWLEQHKIEVI